MSMGLGAFIGLPGTRFLPEACILCRCIPPEEELTREHVFPQWLQHRFDLWNCTMMLQNRTHIQYRYLTVVACRTCNNLYLRPLEDAMSAAIADGYEAVKKLPPFVVTQWMAKIFLGLQLKECSLLLDRRRPELGTILTPDRLERFELLSFWLNTLRMPLRNGPAYSSVALVRTKSPKDVLGQFDFCDSVAVHRRNTTVASIRMGEVGILVHFGDYLSHNESVGHAFRLMLPNALHPTQFRELAAKWAYKASLMRLEIAAGFVGTEDDRMLHRYELNLPLGNGELYTDWDNKEYAQVLSSFMEMPFEQLYELPGHVRSWLLDEGGKPVDMPLQE